jgi:hypothetical protein
MVEEEILVARASDKAVVILGLNSTHKADELHVYVNGVNITKNVVLETVRITVEKKST